MKTLIYSLLLTLISICLIAACDVTESNPELLEEQSLNLTEMKNSENIKPFKNNRRAVPFKSSFFTELNREESGKDKGDCTEEPFNNLNVQEGYGQATHLGRFSTRITFCADLTDILDDGSLTGDDSLPYINGQGIFIAANGDELYFTIEGAVLPTDKPGYNFEFQDPFTFTGGTGRFAGVSGSGTTDSFVHQPSDRTDHSWNAKLIFNRKK